VSDLTAIEKRKLERALGMGSGYVLNFSNRTLAEFFLDSFGINIYDAKYDYGSGSKANRMRAFWEQESNQLVGKVLGILFEEWHEFAGVGSPGEPPEECIRIVRRLQGSAPVSIGAISSGAERRLRVFLCHSSGDKPVVRTLYSRLCSDGFEPWFDEEALVGGQDWQLEISRAVRKADVVLVCLSSGSVMKAGFVQKEIKYALDVADEQPEGAIFIIPLRLDKIDVPMRLGRWQWVNYFDNNGHDHLLRALCRRASDLGISSAIPGSLPGKYIDNVRNKEPGA
jgi:hypothetical protein